MKKATVKTKRPYRRKNLAGSINDLLEQSTEENTPQKQEDHATDAIRYGAKDIAAAGEEQTRILVSKENAAAADPTFSAHTVLLFVLRWINRTDDTKELYLLQALLKQDFFTHILDGNSLFELARLIELKQTTLPK